jgi:hypothetical protein
MHDVNGLAVPQRPGDGYVNATKLCKASKTGKLFADYRRLESTQEYLEALSSDMGIPISDKCGLIQTQKGGKPQEQGTWVHPDIAVDLAKWLSPQFRVIVNRWVREWLTQQSQPQRQSQQHQQLWWDRMVLFHKYTRIPDDHWCIFLELNNLLISRLESKGFVFPDRACPDISVGLCWCRYLRSQGIMPEEFPDYEHHYPDHRGVVDARVYPNKLLPMFRDWLAATYIPGQFPEYVR